MLNRQIQIGMSADSRTFRKDVYSAVDSLTAFQKAATAAQSSVARVSFPSPTPGLTSPAAGSPPRSSVPPPSPAAAPAGGPESSGAGSSLGDLEKVASSIERIEAAGMIAASKIRQSLTAAIAPFGSFVAGLAQQFRIVGGTVVEFADKMNYLGKRSFAAIDVMMQMMDRMGQKMKAFKPEDIKPFPVPFRAKDMIFMSTQGASVKKTLKDISGVRFDGASASAGKLSTSIRIIGPAAQQAARSVRSIGTEIALAFGFVGIIYKATQALTSFFGGGIKGAISLVETENKVKVAFASSAATVISYSEQMATAFGIPKGVALDAASSFGLMSVGAGQTKEASAALSTTLVQLAADTSSLYNIPFAESLGKIQSALAGESKPLRELGVMMDEDKVKAEGMALGFTRAKQQLDDAGKFAARSSLIIKGLSVATGDLTNTQRDTANQNRILKGSLTNLSTDIGKTLLPAINRCIGLLGEFTGAAASAFAGIKAPLQGAVAAVVAGLEEIGVVFRNLPLFGQLAWIKIQEGVYNTIAVFETIPANLSLIADYLGGNWYKLMSDAVSAVWTVFQNLGNNIGELWHAITHVFETGEWSPNYKPLLDGFKATAAELPALVKPQFVEMGREYQAVLDEIARNEAARKGLMAPKPPVPETPMLAGGAEKKEKGDGYKGTAAVEIGSKEANATLAKFYNQSSGNEAKETAKNTKDVAKHTKTMAEALTALGLRGGFTSPSNLSVFTF